jgi:hypothetical protein
MLSEFAQMRVDRHETRDGLNSHGRGSAKGACDPQGGPLLYLVHKQHKCLALSALKEP